ncbi:MAG: hypothetical protein IJP66_00420 [Kiritimatiellae bacterium]|nr:hypothetical protein [Kiritimatiellia bacterium]
MNTSASAPAERGRISIPAAPGDATARIQVAIDDAFRAGGGVVAVEAGVHNVRGLRLRSHVTLLLRSGALLSASRDPADYDILAADALEPVPPEAFAQGVVWQPAATRKSHDHLLKSASRWNNAVIRIYRATGAKVIGEPGSAIDGRDGFDPLGEEGFRGVHGISAHDCAGLELRGYEIRNTGNWAHAFWRCRDVAFSDLTILGGHDGIHVCSCDRVTIDRCAMKTGDDCVAGFDNEDVAVRDCDLNTACSAFRFGGRRVAIERCRCHGPGEYPIRNTLTREEQVSGSHGAPGAGRRTMLSLFTYYADFTLPVRSVPGEITVSHCSLENAERFLHYNFSGNEVWQKGAPLEDIRFEDCAASGVGMSLCAYGDPARPLALSLLRCRIAFATPQREFIRAAHLRALALDGTHAENVAGPCVRSWGGVDAATLSGTGRLPRLDSVVEADEPFKTTAI